LQNFSENYAGVVVWLTAGQQFPAGSFDKTAGSRYYVVKIIKRSSDDSKTTEDDE